MACNVWLSFFRNYDAVTFRRLEYKYITACYGIPLIPSFTYLFIRTGDREKIFGSAVVSTPRIPREDCLTDDYQLWCWVKIQWDFLRVATFYGPVWIVILCTIGIYIRVGKIVLDWRSSVLSMEGNSLEHSGESTTNGIIKTLEVTVTRTQDTAQLVRPNSHVTKKPSFSGAVVGARSTTMSRVYRSGGAINPNKAAIKYCRCALLFFIALLITWVPSTLNRIYTLVRPNRNVFGLYLAAAVVLPLQGFWNAVIYIATSTFAVRSLWRDILCFCGFTRPLDRPIAMTSNCTPPLPVQAPSAFASSSLRYDPRTTSSQDDLVRQSH